MFYGTEKGYIVIITILKRGSAWAGIHHESNIVACLEYIAFTAFFRQVSELFGHRIAFIIEFHST